MPLLSYTVVLKKDLFKEKISQIIFNFVSSFKIDNITLDPNPNWANILDPDPNSMYLDPQHYRQRWTRLSYAIQHWKIDFVVRIT